MTYHNTTHAQGEQLESYQVKASSQDGEILEWFENQGSRWTPSEIQRHVLPAAPITSIRRSISNLTAMGYLVKTDQQKLGPYKRPEHQWTAQEQAA